MLLSVNLDDIKTIEEFQMQKAITVAKMINQDTPKIEFLLNSESLMFTVKDRPSGSPVMGMYYWPQMRADIFIEEKMNHEKMMSTVLHEFAHHLQYKSRLKAGTLTPSGEGWTRDLDHPRQHALYEKYKNLCKGSYAGHSSMDMGAEAFRLVMGWNEYFDWEFNQSFKDDWFEFFYSQRMFSCCLGASTNYIVRTKYYSKMIEDIEKEDFKQA